MRLGGALSSQLEVAADVALDGGPDCGDDGVVGHARERLHLPDLAREAHAEQLRRDEARSHDPFLVCRADLRRPMSWFATSSRRRSRVAG